MTEETGKSSGGGWSELVKSVLIAIALALVIRTVLFQPFYIPSGSMEPTLLPGDRIIVSKLTYRFNSPTRGDVLVFRYPVDPTKDYIKRVIGLGGEKLEVRDNHVYVDGIQLEEDYLPNGLVLTNFGPVKVPPDSYFMMGDNRNKSQDSRIWGPLPKENIVGKATVIFWPIFRWGGIK